MIDEELNRLEELQHQLDRARRRDKDKIAVGIRSELQDARKDLLQRLVKRQNSIGDDTYAQRNRRNKYRGLIEDLRDELEESGDEQTVTLGDLADIST